MPPIEYIGLKPTKTDNVAGTPTAWNGAGDVQDVSDEAAPKLLAYPGVWRLAGGATMNMNAEEGALKVVDAVDTKQPEAPSTQADAAIGDTTEKAALLAVASGMGLKVDGRMSAKTLASMIDKAKA